MNLRRLLKILVAGFISQGVTIVSQLLVPPFFLRYYGNGIAVYGEWLALSASISYLGMFNHGLQNYANNEMTILHNAGDTAAAKDVQSSALRLLLALIALFVVLGAAIFLMPIAGWLRLQRVTNAGAQMTLYLLVLQLAGHMLFTLFTNGFMMVGLPHRGNYWESAQRLLSTLGMAVAIYLHAPFQVLAAVQLAALAVCAVLVMVDTKLTAPVLVPSLRFGSWKQARVILKPSGHFGLFAVAGFLTWQGPILLIQRVLGAEMTGVFGLVRTVFQMSRQVLMIASSTISQDITEMWGRKNWPQLRKLYDLSERLVLFLIPVVTIGTLLLSPLLFTVWLHKRNLYAPELCFLMAVISGVLGIKEHKTQFQSASNRHEETATMMTIGYATMLLAAWPTMQFFGLTGFLVTWLAWEIVQTVLILRQNERLFPAEYRVETRPLVKLAVFTVLAFAAAVYPAVLEQRLPLGSSIGLALAVCLVLSAVAYRVFGMSEVWNALKAKMRNRRVAA